MSDPSPKVPAAAVESLAIKMDKRVDLALSVSVALLGGYICIAASGFRTGSFPDPMTPRGLPYITGAFMILAGLFGAARRLIAWRNLPGNKAVSEGKEDDPAHASSALRPYGMMALALAWCVLLRPLGYLIVTPPMLFGMVWLMGVRSPGKLVGFPVLYTLIVWAVFSQVLSIIMPLGPLTALARSWGLTP